MKHVLLLTGETALVDDCYYDSVMKHSWYFNGKYIYRQGGNICLHQYIVSLRGEIVEVGLEIDHKNRNKFDNQSENLRVVTVSQNQHNTGERQDNTSGCKGVTFNKDRNNWDARIRINGRRYHLGVRKTFEEAVALRKRAEERYLCATLREATKKVR